MLEKHTQKKYSFPHRSTDIWNGDEIDRKDVLLRGEREAGYLREHKKKLRKGRCLKNTQKYSFPHRSTDIWNGEEIDRKDLLLRGEREAGCLREHKEKTEERKMLEKHTKV